LLAKGEFTLLNQNLIVAQQKSGQPVRRGTMAHDHHVFMLLTDAAALKHDLDSLLQYAPQLEALALRDDHQLYWAIAQRAWGVAHLLKGANEEAASRLGKAEQVFKELGAAWQYGRTCQEMGKLALARGDKAGARSHFARAIQAFEGLKAAPYAEQIQRIINSI
jgi:hypothetical protein